MVDPNQASAPAFSQRPATVLNVNDNDAARYMTTLMLRRGGFVVLEARDGASALRMAERLPEVMVLDVRLPDIDGFEVCRRVKADPRTASVKVLHTSATFVTLEKKIQGLEIGADGYLTQPFESQELVATVQSLVRLARAEEVLRLQAAELREADRRKDEFLAMLAHELRNPLAAISASLPLISQRDATSPVETRARDVVQRQVVHLGRLVDDLVDVARVTRGKIDLRKDPIELGSLLQRVTSAARDLYTGARKQVVSLHLPPGPVHVEGDATRLEQVFMNLLDNASKYTDPGGAIEARVTVTDRVVVSVRDNGIGIAPDVLPTLFELFAQAGVSIDRSRGGLGIGLALVKMLVEQHGGQVSAHSPGLGRGSVFEVVLPLAAAHSVSAHPPRLVEDTPMTTSRRILIVEDNSDAQQALADLCEMWGHAVRTASDGRAGVQSALEHKPEVALVDIGLPGLDGYEVAKAIRADPRGSGLYLVALTGYGSPEQKAKALGAGFDVHLVKPVDPDRLETLLRDLPQIIARTASRTA